MTYLTEDECEDIFDAVYLKLLQRKHILVPPQAAAYIADSFKISLDGEFSRRTGATDYHLSLMGRLLQFDTRGKNAAATHFGAVATLS